MHFLNTISILALTGLAIANPTPDTTAPATAPVKLVFHVLPTCGDHPSRGLALEANTCYSLGGARGMRIVEKDGGLKYNALRLFKGQECKGGWTLQPLDDKCWGLDAGWGSAYVSVGE